MNGKQVQPRAASRDQHELLIEFLAPVERDGVKMHREVRAWLDHSREETRFIAAGDQGALHQFKQLVAAVLSSMPEGMNPAQAILKDKALRKLVAAVQVDNNAAPGTRFVSYRNWPQ